MYQFVDLRLIFHLAYNVLDFCMCMPSMSLKKHETALVK